MQELIEKLKEEHKSLEVQYTEYLYQQEKEQALLHQKYNILKQENSEKCRMLEKTIYSLEELCKN